MLLPPPPLLLFFFDVSLFANGGSLLLEEKIPKVPPIKFRASPIFPHFWSFFPNEDDNRELLGTNFISSSSSPSHPAQRHLIFLPRRKKNLFSLNLLLLFFITCRSPKNCESAPTVVFYSVDKSGDFYLFENWVPPSPRHPTPFPPLNWRDRIWLIISEQGSLKKTYFLAFQLEKRSEASVKSISHSIFVRSANVGAHLQPPQFFLLCHTSHLWPPLQKRKVMQLLFLSLLFQILLILLSSLAASRFGLGFTKNNFCKLQKFFAISQVVWVFYWFIFFQRKWLFNPVPPWWLLRHSSSQQPGHPLSPPLLSLGPSKSP